MRVIGLITRPPRCCWALVFSCVVALTFTMTPTSAAGGVVVVGVDLSDNADDDGFADTHETVPHSYPSSRASPCPGMKCS